MNSPNPLQLFKLDQQAAKNQKDPYAGLCVVSTINKDMQPQSRTLVLREVEGSLAIFINKSSPKWNELKNGIAVQTYWASTQVQYRMSVSTKPVNKKIIKESWQLRPDIPKKMDTRIITKTVPQFQLVRLHIRHSGSIMRFLEKRCNRQSPKARPVW